MQSSEEPLEEVEDFDGDDPCWSLKEISFLLTPRTIQSAAHQQQPSLSSVKPRPPSSEHVYVRCDWSTNLQRCSMPVLLP